MLVGWGGDGFDTITEKELKKVGFDTCAEYCKGYCWLYGYGWCPNCAFDKERERRQKEGEVKPNETDN